MPDKQKAMNPENYSPCTGVCKIHESTQRCLGCERTIDEITRWRLMDEDEKLSVLSVLAQRRQKTYTDAEPADDHEPDSAEANTGEADSHKRGSYISGSQQRRT